MDKKNNYNKPLKKALGLLNSKYKIEIIFNLRTQKMRFGQIKNNIETITQQLLSKLLKEMEQDNLIIRKQFEGFPRKVEYSLTPFGHSLKPLINLIIRWENNNSNILKKLIKKMQLDTLFDYY